MISTFRTVAALLCVFALAPASAGDATAGQAKSAACAGCHGVDGNSASPMWPKIAGQNARYIIKQLSEFKKGERKNATMNAIAAALSDADMADLAAFYTAQKARPEIANGDWVDVGAKIYRGGIVEKGVTACIACHGPRGNGNKPARFPVIHGQHADYTEKALRDFRSGERAADPKKMMQMIAANMTDQDIKAVAQYIQGLH
ncbi:MAG: cytochrome c4 [Chromatiales bacterium]|nr:cytochrome c4 [Chromatiales bacterium]